MPAMSKAHTSTTDSTPHTAAKPVKDSILRMTSTQLFAGHFEIEINHNGCAYRLRQTSLGKLILTK
jgi:hemin uptake protein HemP